MTQKNAAPDCRLWRRFSAICYDAILLFAVLFLATALLLPLTGGEAIDGGNLFYFLYLLMIGYIYFAWQWVHGGQTLGMKAWRIRAVADGGLPLSWYRATNRWLFSILSWLLLGGGFLWALFDRNGRALHDRLSGTHLIVVRD